MFCFIMVCQKIVKLYLDFDHGRRGVVFSADVLARDDGEGDVGRVEAILTLAGRKETLVKDVARVPSHWRSKNITLKK